MSLCLLSRTKGKGVQVCRISLSLGSLTLKAGTVLKAMGVSILASDADKEVLYNWGSKGGF